MVSSIFLGHPRRKRKRKCLGCPFDRQLPRDTEQSGGNSPRFSPACQCLQSFAKTRLIAMKKSTGDWIRLDASQFNEVHEEEQGGIRRSLSPYDIPEAVRGHLDYS